MDEDPDVAAEGATYGESSADSCGLGAGADGVGATDEKAAAGGTGLDFFAMLKPAAAIEDVGLAAGVGAE